MSYSIYIGEAEIENEIEDGEFCSNWIVMPTHDEKAPTFKEDGLTGCSNGRHPAYSVWSNFVKEAKLYDLFFDKDEGLMRKHPGCFTLTSEHLNAVRWALGEWKKKHPDSVAGWGIDEDGKERDGGLARLIWLEWWIDWALRNCKQPAIYNY